MITMKVRKRAIGAGIGALALVGALAPTADAATTAVTCGAYYSIDTSGAHAQVRECHDGSQVRVDGTVKDLDADGQCARVYASYNQTTVKDYSPTACPKGTTVSFTFPWRTSTDAYIYLQEIDA